jgi:hypothetical protein
VGFTITEKIRGGFRHGSRVALMPVAFALKLDAAVVAKDFRALHDALPLIRRAERGRPGAKLDQNAG